VTTVRFTRRCFTEDLGELPRRIASQALDAAEVLEKNPELGEELVPPLDRFRRLRLGGRYRLIYTYDSDTDTWWICLIWERKPGKPEDVYEILKRLVESLKLK